MNTLKKIVTALTFSTLCIAFTSSATPIITEWDWEVDTAFTDFAHAVDVTGTVPNDYWDDDPTLLSWGIPVGSDQSSLDVSSGSSGNTSGDITGSETVQTATLTHNNFVINAPEGDITRILTAAELSTNLMLTYDDGGDVTFSLPSLVFDILFKETPNSGTCAVESIIKCSDIFLISLSPDSGEAIIDGAGNFLQYFDIEEHTYQAKISVSGLGLLVDPVCSAAGATSPCIGLTTVERQSNEFDVFLKITLVPEPASILLMSLALFGIFASARNKHI